jgi:hypothetical protein
MIRWPANSVIEPRTPLVVAATLWFSLLGMPTYAHAQAQPTVQSAIARLQAGDPGGAGEILEQVLAAEPDNGRAWNVLGIARQRAGDADGARQAYEKAASDPVFGSRAMYNLGVLLATEGDLDGAFGWLLEAKGTGSVDLTGIGASPAGAALSADPRYESLFPDESDFALPFSEPVTVIHEWRGEAAGDQFGWIARNMGDVDGDGVDDVTTSAPTNGENGQNAGKVYAYSGRSGVLLWTALGPEGGQLGLGIEAAGDVNADGVPDVIAGAPYADRAFVYSGLDGRVVMELEARQTGELFGRKVGDLGDVNSDGHDDVFVGAPQNDAVGEDAGRGYVFSGRDGSVLLTLDGEEAGDNFGSSGGGSTDAGGTFIVVGSPNAGLEDRGRTYVYRGLDPEPAFVIEADETGAQLGGMFVSMLGDVDGDGVSDVYASDWSNGAAGPSTGRAYVHSGADGCRLYTFTGEAAGDGFGIGVADVGDVDADGHADLLIGAWQHAGAAASGGKLYLYSGADGSLVRTVTGRVMGETLGFDTTGVGDVDGDGHIDWLVTSAWSAVMGSRSGRMYILSGAPEG